MMAEMTRKIKRKGCVLTIQSLPCFWGNYLAWSEIEREKMMDFEVAVVAT